MPKREDVNTVLVIGSGPIIIGQACEFDYSGTQACKALRQLGYRIVLVNSNPATIMTDPQMADVTYIEPLGMNDTDFWVPAEKQDRLAKVYDCREGQPSVRYLDNNLGIQNDMAYRPAYEAGGAGLASTIDDYAKFTQMLLNGGTYNGVQILRPATVKFLGGHTLSAVQHAGFDNWIGLEGFSYGNLMRVLVDPTRAVTLGSKGEFGWDGWLGCYMEVVPEQNMTFLMMTQKKDAGTYTLSRKIRNIIFSE